MSLVFEQLYSLSEANREQIQSLYELSFPPAERKPFELILRRFQAGEYLCFVAKSSEDIIGFAWLLPLSKVDGIFLEYVAVDASHQSKGVGAQLLRFIIEKLSTRLIWEVEPPVNDDSSDVRNRRLRFYERLGAKVIELSTGYQMPNFELGEGGVSLLLLQWPLEVQPNLNEVRTIVEGIYGVAYPEWTELRDAILASFETRLSSRS